MWHFKDLSKDQKHERRRLLDLYGSIAQCSVLIPLFLLQIYFLAAYTWRYIRKRRGGQIPSSPQLKRKRRDSVARVSGTVSGVWRRVLWSAGDEVKVLGFVGTKGEVLGSVVWLGWLLVLSGLQTEGDYLHLTKRLGIVGASQLPFQYLLALKSPWSPLYHLTGLTWEHLNVLHQSLGRITTLLFYLHTALYLNFFIQASVLTKRLQNQDVILGLLAITAFTAVGTTSLHWLRKLNYRIFYTVHVSLATILLPVLYFHVHHIRLYILETLFVLCLHNILRYFSQTNTTASITLIPGTQNLLQIKVPKSKRDSSLMLTWKEGQHFYISPNTGGLTQHPLKSKNPFTVASVASLDKELIFIARIHDGNTAALALAAAATTEDYTKTTPLTLEGPYGSSTLSISLLRHTRTIFVAGGVGATFVMPLYRTLLGDLSPSAGSRRRQAVKFLWMVRDMAEVSWVGTGREEEDRGIKERMRVFVTRNGMETYRQRRPKQEEDGDGGDDEGVEMERLLPGGGAEDAKVGAGGDWDVRYGRPDVGSLIDETLQRTLEDESVAIVVCGPKTLSDEVRRKTGKWVGKRNVWLHVEAFGL